MFFTINTVKTRLLTIVIVGMAAISLAAIINAIQLTKKLNHFEALVTVDSAHAIALGKINQDFKTQVQEWKNVLLRGHDTEDREKYWSRFLKQQALIQQQSNALMSLGLPHSVQQDLQQFAQSHASIITQYKKGYALYLSSNFDHKLADKAVRGIDRDPSKTLSASIEKMDAIKHAKSTALIKESNRYQTYAFIAIAIVFLGCLLISSRIITQKISTPISQLIKQLSKVSSGDFTAQVRANSSLKIGAIGEIAEMANAIDTMRSKMSKLTDALDAEQSDLNSVSANISASAASLSHKADEQYQQAVDIDAATIQMANASRDMESSIVQASSIASAAAKAAQNSRSVMQSTLNSIETSTQQIQRTSGVIAKLDEDTQTVGSVVEVINGIAEQTNLLALNAAIEAARAGEQGRGFAVVADEVRTLASRTQQSTEEIKTIIAKLQERALEAVSQIQEGENSVTQTQNSVNQASEVLCDVDTAVSDITNTNEHIKQLIDEQAHLNTSVGKKVETLRMSAEQNKSQAQLLLEQNVHLEEVRAKLALQMSAIRA